MTERQDSMALPSSLEKLEAELDKRVEEISAERAANETVDETVVEESRTYEKQPEDDEKNGEDTRTNDESSVVESLKARITELEAENRSLDNDNRSQRIKRGDAERRVSELEAEIQTLKEAAAKPQQVVLTDEDKELLEAEGISEDVVKILGKTLSKKDGGDDELKKLREDVGTIKAQSEKDRFYGTLSASVPDWETINNDPAFVKWLGAKVPYQDYTIHERLNAAGQILDSKTVIDIFKSYIDSTGGEKKERKSLKDLVEPSTKRTGATTTKEGKIWKREEIRKFYTDCATGKISEKEAAEIEKQITAASAEGRIK